MRRLGVTVLAALAFPASAAAHASLERTTPHFGTRLQSSPRVIRLQFDQSVKALPNAIDVFTAKGRTVSGTTRSSTDRRMISVPVSHLGRGAYTVRWRVVSADGHVVSAVFPLLAVFRPRSPVLNSGFALTFVVLAVLLYCDRDVAPIFGHISPLAGTPHR